jgi:hypothetical protein
MTGPAVDKPKHTAPRIEYVAPLLEIVEDFAVRICLELANRSGDPRLTNAGMIKGFVAFLYALLTVVAKRRNREASFDTSIEHHRIWVAIPARRHRLTSAAGRL